MADKTYRDAKGRLRWLRNDEVAHRVKQLGDYLIIGGYPEQHAARYARIAHAISRHPEDIDRLCNDSRLAELPGVGGVITGYLESIVRTGHTDKFDDDQYGTPPPITVLELTDIERLGAKTARTLFQEHGICSLAELCEARADGRLSDIKGMGPRMLETIDRHCADHN